MEQLKEDRAEGEERRAETRRYLLPSSANTLGTAALDAARELRALRFKASKSNSAPENELLPRAEFKSQRKDHTRSR